jgi:omega-amidase
LIQEEHILTVSIVQPNLIWEGPEANYTLLESLVKSINVTDLIVLPEMFSTGFSMQPKKFYETMGGRGVEWMLQLADKTKAAVTGSLIIKENEKFYNRLLWATPEGGVYFYDKRHLFSFAGEDAHYSRGDSRLIVELKGWKICPLICYDLRFPIWSRNQNLKGKFADFEYDLLIYVANWPEARSSAWKTLLSARAHENQAFVVGVNRVGQDGNQINHSGDSCIISPKGELIESIQPNKASVATSELNLKELREFRTKFGAWRDKDQFEIK